MKKALLILSVLFLAVFTVLFSSANQPVQTVSAQAADTCPDGDGWVKVDGLSGLTYTFTDIPEGFFVTENCMKVGDHEPVFGTGPTVTNATLFNAPGNPPAVCTAPGVPHNGCSLQTISHASFLLVSENGGEEEEEEDKVNICHATGSENNPWEAIRVNASAFDGEGDNDHTLHGDFLYEGPVNPNNQQPTSDEWCEEDEDEDSTPTPTPTNTPTPTPTQTPNVGGDGDGKSDGRSDGRSDGLSSGVGGAAVLGATTAAKRGEVLGASTMAATGSFPTTLASMEQVFGAALVVLGAGLHGKKKFFKKSK